MITTKPLRKSEHDWLPFDCTVKFSTRRKTIQLSISDQIYIHCPTHTSINRLRHVILSQQQWVVNQLKMQQAAPILTPRQYDREVILDRVDIWSAKMGLFPSKVVFKRYRSKWGSCTTDGTLSFNESLMKAPLDIIDYVVVHELAHLKLMNHSPQFWELVHQFYPHYTQARKWLRIYASQLI